MAHVVLLGDSTFDNALYSCGKPDVISHVRQLLPSGWSASLLAVDSSTIGDIAAQIRQIPADATHLILSVGSGDAIANFDELLEAQNSAAEFLTLLADIAKEFAEKYRAAIEACRETQLPLTVCTVRDGRFPDPLWQRTASALFLACNGAILRTAHEFSLSVIDVRMVCQAPSDYANAIELSSTGGRKIARSIVEALHTKEKSRAAAGAGMGFEGAR